MTVDLEIYTRAAKPIFVSRLANGEFVTFNIIGPDGKELPRQGRVLSGTRAPADFAKLETYRLISGTTVISLKDGAGFVFDKPGEYFLTSEYSLGPPESFASFAGETEIPTGVFRSTKVGFCIEACIREPFPVHNNPSQLALESVRAFYTYITRYHQLGIPYGQEKKRLWPLLSKRLAQELEGLEACDKDYYRRYGKFLRAHTYKPATPWLESGLFTGPNDAATPRTFRILDSRAIGDNRVDVELEFTTTQTYSPELGVPPSYERYSGDVTAILENQRWVIDDYLAMYENDELIRLSDGYAECKDGQWVGEKPN